MAFVGPLSGSHGFTAVTGSLTVSQGISGSITRLHDGKSFIEAGANITVTSASNGAVTITSTAGGSVAGSDTQYQYNNGGSFGGAADLTFNDSTGDTTVGADTGDAKLFFRDSGIYLYSSADGHLEIDSDTRLSITGSGNVADAVALQADHSDGGIDIDAGTAGIDIRATGPLMLSSSLNDGNALQLYASAGGMELGAAGAAGEDIVLTNAAGSIQLVAGEDATDSILLDATGDIVFDADGGDIYLKDGGAEFGKISNSSSDLVISASIAAKDIIFKGQGSGASAEVARFDMSAGSFLVAASKKIEVGGTNNFIISDNQSLTGSSAAEILLDAAGDIILDADAADVVLKDNGTVYGALTAGTVNSSANSLTITAGGSYIAASDHVVPSADVTYDLGAESLRWRQIYTGDLHLKNDRGNWTLIEENSFLSLRNNKTGQRFKFLMELLPEDDWDPDGTWVEPIE